MMMACAAQSPGMFPKIEGKDSSKSVKQKLAAQMEGVFDD